MRTTTTKLSGSPSYPGAIDELLTAIRQGEDERVADAASLMRSTVDGGGLVFVFGSGHSSVLVEEAFHRAGGLIPVYPVLHDFISPHTTPKISGKLERLEGVAPILFARAGARKGDMMWIASNSGINAASIEMALECRKAGVSTVALTSLTHSRSATSRHSSGKKLFECCDIVIDNHCPPGDALVEIAGVRVAAGSTIANAFVYNWALARACDAWAAAGKTLPIYKSANVAGGDQHNETLEAPYRARIPQL
ncbi:MAG: SIS domain-containing protein [Deltaproteobacteria bacterium]|nr:SIS domain-containing protein [Deltaproteobacteria bacterium]